MEQFRAFLRRKNIVFSAKRYPRHNDGSPIRAWPAGFRIVVAISFFPPEIALLPPAFATEKSNAPNYFPENRSFRIYFPIRQSSFKRR